jgi:hypothetical protein
MVKKVGGPIHPTHSTRVEKTKVPSGLKELSSRVEEAVEGKFGAGKHLATPPPSNSKRVASFTKKQFGKK